MCGMHALQVSDILLHVLTTIIIIIIIIMMASQCPYA